MTLTPFDLSELEESCVEGAGLKVHRCVMCGRGYVQRHGSYCRSCPPGFSTTRYNQSTCDRVQTVTGDGDMQPLAPRKPKMGVGG